MIYRSSYGVIKQSTARVLISVAILICSSNLAQAAKASLRDIVLDSNNENLTLSFKLENAFPAEITRPRLALEQDEHYQ